MSLYDMSRQDPSLLCEMSSSCYANIKSAELTSCEIGQFCACLSQFCKTVKANDGNRYDICFCAQSHRFALVCVGSEASSRKLMELLSKRELHGQNPIVTPCNKQSLSQFEMQSRKSKWDKRKCLNTPASLLITHFHSSEMDNITHIGLMYKYTCHTYIIYCVIKSKTQSLLSNHRYSVRPDVWGR